MTNGILSIKHRKSTEESTESSSQQRRRPSYRVFVKGKNYFPKQVLVLSNPQKLRSAARRVVCCWVIVSIHQVSATKHLDMSRWCLSLHSLMFHPVSWIISGLSFFYRMIISSANPWNSIWLITTSSSRNLMYPRLWIQLCRYDITCV